MHTQLITAQQETLSQLRAKYRSIIRGLLPGLEEHYYSLNFENVMIDSIDLIAIRVEIEQENGREIPDQIWLDFKSLDEIINYCSEPELNQLNNEHEVDVGSMTPKKEITVNMPQMAIGALSESWLFKELGNMHWEMLCNGLNTNSHEISDEFGNRLYATFVRIQISSSSSIASIKENDKIEIDEEIMRYGAGMYFSNILLNAANCKMKASLMTSFALRSKTDNTQLVKSQPTAEASAIPLLTGFPPFANEYRNIKKGLIDQLRVGGEIFTLTDAVIYESEYHINPYYDLNGVGLLYFAAYPIISDNCEATYFNQHNIGNDYWETRWATKDRDVFYYGNCNINETIIYRLHMVELPANGVIKTYSSLRRRTDGKLLAQIFTIKMIRA